MSATMECFFKLNKVVDHDCGNYRIGALDFINYAAIREYVAQHGDFAWEQLTWVCAKILSEAQDQLLIERMKNQDVGCKALEQTYENI